MQSFKLNNVANRHMYDIAFVGLKPGIHHFNYELDEQFFAEKEASDVQINTASIRLSLEKNSSFMLLKFEVGGKGEAPCDRCGNPLKLDLWDEFNMLVKLVDDPDKMNAQEEDPDVFYISRTESHLHVEDWLYEFALLSVPMQKMCSEEEMGGPQCNNEVLEKLRKMEEELQKNTASGIWKGLEKFKDN